ncbi:hypothetical protein GGS21DRAFT_486241 [Xylaria nigripes]|nr:hypothetical protein GGS21DRAFT_486241 [Xylaria nigripes]
MNGTINTIYEAQGSQISIPPLDLTVMNHSPTQTRKQEYDHHSWRSSSCFRGRSIAHVTPLLMLEYPPYQEQRGILSFNDLFEHRDGYLVIYSLWQPSTYMQISQNIPAALSPRQKTLPRSGQGQYGERGRTRLEIDNPSRAQVLAFRERPERPHNPNRPEQSGVLLCKCGRHHLPVPRRQQELETRVDIARRQFEAARGFEDDGEFLEDSFGEKW